MPPSNPHLLEPATVRHVAGTCLCLQAQRAARALARRFDAVLAPFGLTNGQFSLLMALNTDPPPSIGRLAEFLAMDRTTLTAALKPLERRGLLTVQVDAADRRSRRVLIRPDGVALLRAAVPVWQAEHARLEQGLTSPADLRTQMGTLAR